MVSQPVLCPPVGKSVPGQPRMGMGTEGSRTVGAKQPCWEKVVTKEGTQGDRERFCGPGGRVGDFGWAPSPGLGALCFGVVCP